MDIRKFLKTKDGKPLMKSIDSTKSKDKSKELKKPNKINKRKKEDEEEDTTIKIKIKPKPILKKQKQNKNQNKPLKSSISSHKLEEKQIIIVKPPRSNANQLWVDKYKPKTKQDLVGNPTLFRDLEQWIQCWDKVHLHKTLKVSYNKKNPGAKAVLMSGSPGIGKSASISCIAKGLGFEVFETNASEARSKKSIEKILNVQVHNSSIKSMFIKDHKEMKINKKKLIIMDEVDGMSTSDRGGVAELIKIIKDSDVPIVCICNDRQKASIRSLANHCYDLRVNRPMPISILKRMQYIAKQENLLVDDKSLEILINSTGNDIRQIINTMQMWKVNASKITPQSLFDNKQIINKDGVQRLTFMSATQFLFNTAGKSPFDLRYNAVFVDFDMIGLTVGENYIKANKTKSLDDISKAADALCNVDIINTRIKGQQQWNLMPHAAVATVSVAAYTKGSIGFPTFPALLGKISKTNKRIRMLGEISSHISANTTASTSSIRLEMMEPLRHFILSPLIEGGNVNETLNRMNTYGLTREDVFENMPELQIHDNSTMFKDIHKDIPSKTKGAFTRAYNSRYQFKP